MNIDQYKQENGWYKSPDGCDYEDAESFISTGILGFCGCGCPDEALKYIRDVLRTFDGDIETRWERQKSFFSNSPSGLDYFVWYVLAEKDLTSHGGSVPGWLTQKGELLLADLEELYQEPKESSQ